MQRVRTRRGALGLRGRIVGAVLVTTVASLTVAAVALLGPLEHSLRNAAMKTLRVDLGRNPASALRGIRLVPPVRATTLDQLSDELRGLEARIGASVTVLGYPDALDRGTPLLTGRIQSAAVASDPFDDAQAAFQSNKAQYSFSSINGTDYARVAVPFRQAGFRFALVVRRPIDEIPAAVHAVRTAFLYAALAGLALTLILAIPLSGRLVSRLRRLRQAALELAHGAPCVTVPEDRARDEVGDLARTFALMQRQLQQQEVARRAFVATASHELRTPLTSLDGMLELLDEDLESGQVDVEDARLLLARARAQSRRLGRLASDLLDLSRIDAEVQLRSEPVELGELSRAVLAEFELGTAERSIRTALDDSPGSVWALGDPGSVAQILRILLDNAVRVSPSGGEIRVELLGGRSAALSVRDQGPGVPDDERDLIFERFQRGRTARGQAGFGLGLAIGRELAERMGGELVLEESDLPGATFTLKLPVASAPTADRIAVA
jgi:signal transduction histidine kinase